MVILRGGTRVRLLTLALCSPQKHIPCEDNVTINQSINQSPRHCRLACFLFEFVFGSFAYVLLQAVLNASSNTDEFIKEALISHNKVCLLA